MSQHDLARRLNRLADGFRRRLRGVIAQTGLCRALFLAMLMFAMIAVFDWRLHLGAAWRGALLAGYVALLAWVIWTTVGKPLRKRWSTRHVLAYLDATMPPGRGMLVDALELTTAADAMEESNSPVGKAMIDAAMTRLDGLPGEANLTAALDYRQSRRWLAITGAAAALFFVVLALAPTYVAIGATRLFNPLSSVRWPHRTTIVVVPPETGWTVPQLESFAIQADVTGEIPQRVTLNWRTSESRNWIRQQLPLDGPASEKENLKQVQYVFPEVRVPIEFYLEGGDYRTDRQTIEIVQRPFLTGITARYSYPSYAGLPDRSSDSGQLFGLEGTRVKLTFQASMPLDRAVMVLTQQNPTTDARGETKGGKPQRIELAKKSDTEFEHTLMLQSNGHYAIELYEANGYREARPEQYDIRVTPDELPEIEITSPAQDLVETSAATVPVEFIARDKLGLASVQLFYRLDDAPPQQLSDRVTGPVAQAGNESRAAFDWQLRRMQLPESGELTWFVRVRDNNPTGRGMVQSRPRSIRLVRSSEFHLESLERAKLLEEEARIAWRNQLLAWRLAMQWPQAGQGEQTDAAWNELVDAQQKSFLAAQQIQFHLQTLTAKYERNHMDRDFMAGRLSVVAGLLDRLRNQEHRPVEEALRAARPKTEADAAPQRLRSLRSTALAAAADRQKMAVLVLERMLRKLYDWRDLQTCMISTKLLHEQQQEVLGRTGEIAPQSIAREIEDLSDDDQDKLLTLGKQQRAIFDAESGLERQISYLMFKAERQRRQSIQGPLQAAFKNLRDNRVNDHLKRAAEWIENNQPSQILDNQRAAMRALEVVRHGLLVAGQKVDPDQPLTLAMTPTDASQFDPDAIKPEQVAENPSEPSDPDAAPETTDVVLEVPTLPEGTDAVSAAIRLAVELQDGVLARTRYLHSNRGEAEMPRFVRLKLLRLGELQTGAASALARARQSADTEGNKDVMEVLDAVGGELDQSQRLLAAGLTDPTVQQIQDDALSTLEELLQLLALSAAAGEIAEENKRLGGVDAFKRPFLLRGDDLDSAVGILGRINLARLRQSDVRRKLQRFAQFPPHAELLREIEKTNHDRARQTQQSVATLVDGAATQSAAVSEPVRARILELGMDRLHELPLGKYAQSFGDAGNNEETIAQLQQAEGVMAAVVQSLRDLLDERVRPEPAVVQNSQPRSVSPEEFQKLISREHLAARLRDEAGLPPEVRRRMVRALQREFPEKYRQLLQAYYGSFISPAGGDTADDASPRTDADADSTEAREQ